MLYWWRIYIVLGNTNQAVGFNYGLSTRLTVFCLITHSYKNYENIPHHLNYYSFTRLKVEQYVSKQLGTQFCYKIHAISHQL